MLKNLSLRAKILVPICGLMVVFFCVAMGFIFQKAMKTAKVEALEKAQVVASQYSGIIKLELEVAMNAARTLATAFEGIKKYNNKAERQLLMDQVRSVLSVNPNFIGMSTCWEPNAFDNNDAKFVDTVGHDSSGRFIPYLYKSGNKIKIEPLVDYDKYGVGDYYVLAKRSGRETLTEPYNYPLDGKQILMTTVSAPIKDNGKFVGVVTVDIALRKLRDLVSNIKLFSSGYISIISNKCFYVTHPKVERIGKNILRTDEWMQPMVENIKTGKGFMLENDSATLKSRAIRIGVPIRIGDTGTPWLVLLSLSKGKIFEKVYQRLFLSVFLCIVILLLMITIIYFIARSIANPVIASVQYAEKMSQGDFSQKLDIDQKDEVGLLADALNKVTSNLGITIKDISVAVEELFSSSTDLSTISKQASVASKNTTNRADSVSVAATEMSEAINLIAATMEQTSTSVGIIANNEEQMILKISEISNHCEKAQGISDAAVSKVDNASLKVEKLGVAVSEITNVTETISEISDQTNLLALNATIEAARAGDAGKGFAVVANEIKELAKQTAEATRVIKEKISGIQGSTDTTVTEIKEITKVMKGVNEIVTVIATSVEEQSVTTKETADNVSQTSQGIYDVNENIKQNSTVAEEIAKEIALVNHDAIELDNNSSQVSVNSDKLSDIAVRLKEIVNQFNI